MYVPDLTWASLQANLDAIQALCGKIGPGKPSQRAIINCKEGFSMGELLIAMMSHEAALRPDSDKICAMFTRQSCCVQGPYKLEVAAEGQDGKDDTHDYLDEDQAEDEAE